jgi:putative FmdB family regulatory protein
MPIYEYECLACGTTFEKRQSFSDEAKADCPNGHKETRRLIAAPAIVFKGSGFYINDSKAKNSASASSTDKNENSKSKSESTSESSQDST